jgi:hypothetical protein
MSSDHHVTNERMPHCLVCGVALRADATLSLGPLVACNRFEKQASVHAHTHPLSITECAACNLVQLAMYPSVDFVRPRLPWIRYNEPSAHLGVVVEQLKTIFPPGRGHVAMGVGPFDAPLIERVARCGFAAKQLDLCIRLPQEPERYPYLESIQALLRPDVLAELASVHGTAPIVSCRYLLEHSHDPLASLQGLSHLVDDDGLLLIEVPDSSKFLSMMDYSFIWEEHICYFTEDTFRTCAQTAGYEIIQFTRFPGVLEDALVFMLRVTKHLPAQKKPRDIRKNSEIFTRYRSNFESLRQRYRATLQAISIRGKKVAIFGAGHQSIMFINALGLAQHISYVIDDAPEKIGYLIPGTAIPIVSSEHLASDPSIEVCLLAVGPNVEEKIRNKCASYLNRGGRMCTIFPGAGSPTIMDGKG